MKTKPIIQIFVMKTERKVTLGVAIEWIQRRKELNTK